MSIEDAKQQFLDIYTKNIKREGSKELLEWLQKSDFFTAPASTRFHNNCTGGLCAHSVNVYNRFKNLLDNQYGKEREKVISNESVAIIALFHRHSSAIMLYCPRGDESWKLR